MTPEPGATLSRRYADALPQSAAAHERARKVIPGGISHDARRVGPFPPHFTRGAGCRKTDVDGRDYIDFVMGHGSLLFGHDHPAIRAAINAQLADLVHAGGCSPLESLWAEAVVAMVPSAEQVRFVMTGTEGTMLALRLARAATGRDRILRVTGHFNGWHDYGMFGLFAPFDQVASAGIPDLSGVVAHVAQGDVDAMREALATKQVAGVILEPEGARAGAIPMSVDTLRDIRQSTREAGTVLIFDEVISGFRLAPGGAQEYFGVTPDLTVFAKAVAGGLPGGAVAGPRSIMELLAHRSDVLWNRRDRVVHTGTWNGNPLSAASGIAALQLAVTGNPQDQAARAAERLRVGMNAAIESRGVNGFVYGHRSSFRLVITDDEGFPPGRQGDETLAMELSTERLLAGIREPLRSNVHLALLLNGLDFMLADHGWVSCVHDDNAIDEAVSRFDAALSDLVTTGAIEATRENH